MKGQSTFDAADALTDRYLRGERYAATAQKCELLIALYFPRVSMNFGRTPEPLKPELHKPPREAIAHLAGLQSAFASDAEVW